MKTGSKAATALHVMRHRNHVAMTRADKTAGHHMFPAVLADPADAEPCTAAVGGAGTAGTPEGWGTPF
ncbi:hypothetical protein Stsp02_37410 [Streptomyces sp. NBRC 14336]|nr:hypothetical protein Stsp02_37410 [Streptomyces sp. NBRC 14336]